MHDVFINRPRAITSDILSKQWIWLDRRNSSLEFIVISSEVSEHIENQPHDIGRFLSSSTSGELNTSLLSGSITRASSLMIGWNIGRKRFVQNFNTTMCTILFYAISNVGAKYILAATKKLYEWLSPSVCLWHLFHNVPIIVSSWNFLELLPMTEAMSMQKVKVRGQRSRSQRSQPNLTVSGL